MSNKTTVTINVTKTPKWCKQLTQWPKDCSSARADDIVEGYDLAFEALGEQVKEKNSSLVAMAYLYRRFGPPALGTDEYKKLCSYYIGTPMKGVYLNLDLSGSPLQYSVGYVAEKHVTDAHYKPIQEAWEAWEEKFLAWYQQSGREQTQAAYAAARFDDATLAEAQSVIGSFPRRKNNEQLRAEGGIVAQINNALIASLRELLRPVYIRDVPINLFGRMEEEENTVQIQEEAMKILIDLDDVGILANRNEPNQDARIARRHGRDLVKKWKDEFPPEDEQGAGVIAR